MQESYTAREIALLMGLTAQAISRRAKREAWASEKRAGRGGGKAYLFASLPADVQAKLRLAEAPKLPASSASVPACIAPGAAPPDVYQRRGLDRFMLVQEFRAAQAKARWGKTAAAVDAFLLAYNSGRLLPDVYGRLGAIKRSSLYGWDKKLKESGEDYLVLCDQFGKWAKGEVKVQGNIGREAEEAFLSCWLHPNRPSIMVAYRAASNILKKDGGAAASYHSFYRFAKQFKARHYDLFLLAREGEKALKDKALPYITRDDTVLSVGDVLVADGHDLNFEIIHPYTGKKARLTLIMFYDWASRLPLGWQIMPTEDTVAISAALRSAIIALGKTPRAVLLDNGKAFKSRYFTETLPDLRELQGLYARLGIACHFAAPYNARAKVIERFFHTFNEQCERLIPSYCGGSIGDKPAWRHRNEKLLQAWHEARTHGWAPTVREAAEIIRLYVQWYAKQPHDGLGGRTPGEVFAAGAGAGVDVSELNRHFLWTRSAMPHNCRVSLFGRAGIDYESDALLGIHEKVLVRFDTADLSQVYLYTQDGGYLGEALPVQAVHPLTKLFGDEVGAAQVKHELKRQRSLKGQVARGLKALGAAPEIEAGLEYLPELRKAPILPASSLASSAAQSESTPKADPAKVASLAALQKRLTAEAAEAAPEHPRPAYFLDDLDRYDWCFRHVHEHGCALSGDDAAFTAEFEGSASFANFRGRYDDLKALFSLKKTKERMAV